MSKLREKTKSVRFKLFATMCIAITIIVAFLILINKMFQEQYYLLK